jgi:hypothetical protein
MLSYVDCEGMSELTTNEIAAIARHMQVPEIIAVEIGANLCRTVRGKDLIERVTCEYLGAAATIHNDPRTPQAATQICRTQ